jgi:nitrite reductase/ring-hydroxylating ferredoxin subunit
MHLPACYQVSEIYAQRPAGQVPVDQDIAIVVSDVKGRVQAVVRSCTHTTRTGGEAVHHEVGGFQMRENIK